MRRWTAGAAGSCPGGRFHWRRKVSPRGLGFAVSALLVLACVLLACGTDDASAVTTTVVTPGGAAGTGVGLGGDSSVGGGGSGPGGTGGAAGAVACDESFHDEPNDTPAEAVNLLVVTDDDPDPWPSFDGVIVDASDVDWYTFLGTDEPGAYVDPELSFPLASTELELCAYFWCTAAGAWGPPEIGTSGAGGGVAHSCPAGTVPDVLDLSSIELGGVSLGDSPGCCTEPGTGAIHLGEDLWTSYLTPFGCSGLTDDMKVYVRVGARHGASSPQCEPYEVDYHY